jgi:hypothetical protein
MLLGIPSPAALRTQLTDTAASILDPNKCGQAYGFLAIVPIKPNEVDALRAVLAEIDAGPSPFGRLPRTHFARFVILPDFVTDPEQEHDDFLDCEYLIFSACFDGDRDSYLDELIEELEPELPELWAHCIGVDPTSAADVKRYLLHNQIDCGLFYSAYGHTTAPEVIRVLRQQRDLRALALEQYDFSPAELQAQFVAQFGA